MPGHERNSLYLIRPNRAIEGGIEVLAKSPPEPAEMFGYPAKIGLSEPLPNRSCWGGHNAPQKA